jgi:hypothetical protein
MSQEYNIPEPILFNPLKHYLPFIREFISNKIMEGENSGSRDFIRELKHLGTCVMDIYAGEMSQVIIFKEILDFLRENNIIRKEFFKEWTGTNYNDYRIISLSDSSQWTLKFFNHEIRYVHIFPARLRCSRPGKAEEIENPVELVIIHAAPEVVLSCWAGRMAESPRSYSPISRRAFPRKMSSFSSFFMLSI